MTVGLCFLCLIWPYLPFNCIAQILSISVNIDKVGFETVSCNTFLFILFFSSLSLVFLLLDQLSILIILFYLFLLASLFCYVMVALEFIAQNFSCHSSVWEYSTDSILRWSYHNMLPCFPFCLYVLLPYILFLHMLSNKVYCYSFENSLYSWANCIIFRFSFSFVIFFFLLLSNGGIIFMKMYF